MRSRAATLDHQGSRMAGLYIVLLDCDRSNIPVSLSRKLFRGRERVPEKHRYRQRANSAGDGRNPRRNF